MNANEVERERNRPSTVKVDEQEEETLSSNAM
jgi:hypothetical protein